MFLKDILIIHKENSKIAIKFNDKIITYKEIFYEIDRKSSIIKQINNITTNIGVFIPNSIHYALAYFSIIFNDKVCVPIDIHIKEFELLSTVIYCELGIIITNTEYKKQLIELLSKCDFQIIIYDIDDDSWEYIGLNLQKFNYSGNTNITCEGGSVAIMLHTSGTTSNPKKVMLTHNNLISNIESNIQSLSLTSNDVVLIALPMFFGYCNTAQFLTHLYLGATIIIMDSIFMANKFFKIVQDEGITNFTGVPTMLLMLLTYRYKFNYNISSLRYICFGGGIMPVEKLRQLIIQFPTVGFVQTYGQTEASPRVTCLLPQDSLRKIGSVGKAIPNVNVRIVGENDSDLGIDEIGEIIVQGPNVMRGYYKRIEETNKVIKNGWLYTGDLGKYDDEGYIFLVGRKKNVIISGGLNIYPEEVEEVLMCHPVIKEAVVIGEKDELLGEVAIAKVVLKENIVAVSESELKNYCFEKVSNYKVPRKIIFTDILSKTANGKIIRDYGRV